MADENVEGAENNTPEGTPVEEAAAKIYEQPEGAPKQEDVSAEGPEKKEEEVKAEEKPDGKADGEKAGAPENYEDFKMPDGMEMDESLIKEFKPVAKELNLSQDGAQKLVDLYNEHASQMLDGQYKAWEDLKTNWANTAKEDKEFGGKEFDESIGHARKALDEFGTDELKEAMDATGVGSHPEFIRFFVRIGKLLSEDKIVQGGNPRGEPRDPAKIMFPDMN